MSGYNPYQPPQPTYPPPGFGGWPPAGDPSAPAPRPGVWWFFLAYCVAMALMYLLVVVMGVTFLSFPNELTESSPDSSPAEAVVTGVFCIGLGLPFAALYVGVLALPKRKWAWICCLVAIGIGLTSVCTLPAAVPLLIFWLKDDMKRFYNVGGPYFGPTYAGAAYPGAPYPGAAYPGAPYPGAAYPGAPYPGAAYPGAPYSSPSYPSQKAPDAAGPRYN